MQYKIYDTVFLHSKTVGYVINEVVSAILFFDNKIKRKGVGKCVKQEWFRIDAFLFTVSCNSEEKLSINSQLIYDYSDRADLVESKG